MWLLIKMIIESLIPWTSWYIYYFFSCHWVLNETIHCKHWLTLCDMKIHKLLDGAIKITHLMEWDVILTSIIDK